MNGSGQVLLTESWVYVLANGNQYGPYSDEKEANRDKGFRSDYYRAGSAFVVRIKVPMGVQIEAELTEFGADTGDGL